MFRIHAGHFGAPLVHEPTFVCFNENCVVMVVETEIQIFKWSGSQPLVLVRTSKFESPCPSITLMAMGPRFLALYTSEGEGGLWVHSHDDLKDGREPSQMDLSPEFPRTTLSCLAWYSDDDDTLMGGTLTGQFVFGSEIIPLNGSKVLHISSLPQHRTVCVSTETGAFLINTITMSPSHIGKRWRHTPEECSCCSCPSGFYFISRPGQRIWKVNGRNGDVLSTISLNLNWKSFPHMSSIDDGHDLIIWNSALDNVVVVNTASGESRSFHTIHTVRNVYPLPHGFLVITSDLIAYNFLEMAILQSPTEQDLDMAVMAAPTVTMLKDMLWWAVDKVSIPVTLPEESVTKNLAATCTSVGTKVLSGTRNLLWSTMGSSQRETAVESEERASQSEQPPAPPLLSKRDTSPVPSPHIEEVGESPLVRKASESSDTFCVESKNPSLSSSRSSKKVVVKKKSLSTVRSANVMEGGRKEKGGGRHVSAQLVSVTEEDLAQMRAQHDIGEEVTLEDFRISLQRQQEEMQETIDYHERLNKFLRMQEMHRVECESCECIDRNQFLKQEATEWSHLVSLYETDSLFHTEVLEYEVSPRFVIAPTIPAQIEEKEAEETTTVHPPKQEVVGGELDESSLPIDSEMESGTGNVNASHSPPVPEEDTDLVVAKLELSIVKDLLGPIVHDPTKIRELMNNHTESDVPLPNLLSPLIQLVHRQHEEMSNLIDEKEIEYFENQSRTGSRAPWVAGAPKTFLQAEFPGISTWDGTPLQREALATLPNLYWCWSGEWVAEEWIYSQEWLSKKWTDRVLSSSVVRRRRWSRVMVNSTTRNQKEELRSVQDSELTQFATALYNTELSP